MADLTYILPLRSAHPLEDHGLDAYLRWLTTQVEVIVVDGSTPDVFDAHHRRWGRLVRHVPVDPDRVTPMGKVGGVLTGVALASCEALVIGDDDVRYDAESLGRVAGELLTVDVVRPQNVYDPLPWWAAWDTARILLNRLWGGDWPGTLGVRRAALLATGGYRGDALFENLELVRTVVSAGGTASTPLDLFVTRRPPSFDHFRSQRVREAYDELARPAHLLASLALLPVAVLLGRRRPSLMASLFLGLPVVAAEAGRRRGGGRDRIPFRVTLFAPLWVGERAVCSWIALGAWARGGARYRDGRLRTAASSRRALRRRLGHDPTRPGTDLGSGDHT